MTVLEVEVFIHIYVWFCCNTNFYGMIFVNVIKTNCFQLFGYKPRNKQLHLTYTSS